MDAVTHPDPAVRETLEAWIERRIDVSASANAARVCRVPAVPAAIALDWEGRILGRRQGFVEPKAFAAWLREARERCAL